MSTLLALPPELILHVLDITSDADAVCLLSTCRTLAAHLTDPSESLWRARCARYNLYDVDSFPSHVRSFRDVYTGLMHPYGALIGLWANDTPFTGEILEFRLAQGVIIGEVWQRQSSNMAEEGSDVDPRVPSPPSYSLTFQFGFHGYDGNATGPRAAACCTVDGSLDHRCVVTLANFVPPEHMLLDLVHQRGLRHNAFPCAPHDNWVDRARLRTGAPPGHYPGLTVKCADGSCSSRRQRHAAWLEEMEQKPRIYYPIRPAAPAPSGSADWNPRVLDGLWLGDYGPHGTEVLFVSFSEASGCVSAVKITGDVNVPRGVTSWQFDVRAGALPHSAIALQEWASDGRPIYAGEARLAAFGYVISQDSPCQVAIFGRDMIKIRWIELEHSSAFVRYMDRESPALPSTP